MHGVMQSRCYQTQNQINQLEFLHLADFIHSSINAFQNLQKCLIESLLQQF